MKHLCNLIAALLLASCTLCPAQDLNVREFRRVVDARNVTTLDRLPWYAGESVGYSIVSRSGTNIVQIPAGSIPIWTVMDSATNAYIVATGTVVNVTNGEVRFWLPAPMANLPSGTYSSYVTAYQGTNRVGVLDRATVSVAWRPGDDFESAQPITNVYDQMLSYWADAAASMQIISNALAEAMAAHAGSTSNPHATTAAQIGALTPAAAAEVYQPKGSYLTTEADVAGLAAAAAVQSNLADLASADVPVSCAGGYYYPDYFSLTPETCAYTVTSYGATSIVNSVMSQMRTYSTADGYKLSPQITRQSDWTEAVVYSALSNLSIVVTNGQSVAQWSSGLSSGAVGRLTATLGDFARSYELTYTDGQIWSNEYWVADAPGTLRALINTSLTARAAQSGKQAGVYVGDAYAATNFVRATNCWAFGVDLSCASPWNSSGGRYYAGTAVTPQHILYARHYMAPVGTSFRFIDSTNGVHDRTLMAQMALPNDIAVGLLSSPLPAAIAPAKILASTDKGCFLGIEGLRECPGYRLLYLDQIDQAWQASGTIDTPTSTFDSIVYMGGSTNLPYSQPVAIGGDSGNPIFLIIGTNTVIYSTFHTGSSGPGLAANAPAIEAAMATMGGSVYTNLTTFDLSSWRNYYSPQSPQ